MGKNSVLLLSRGDRPCSNEFKILQANLDPTSEKQTNFLIIRTVEYWNKLPRIYFMGAPEDTLICDGSWTENPTFAPGFGPDDFRNPFQACDSMKLSHPFCLVSDNCFQICKNVEEVHNSSKKLIFCLRTSMFRWAFSILRQSHALLKHTYQGFDFIS